MTNRHCPYCNHEVDSFSEVTTHCEAYGSQYYNVKCLYCGKLMRIYAVRSVQISAPYKLIEEEINDKEEA